VLGNFKTTLHDDLVGARAAVVAKLEGVSEYDKRRPLTPSGTNLLGLVNHLAAWEAVYLGQIFERPFEDSEPPIRLAEDFDDWRIHQDEASDRVVARFHRVCQHADDTIRLLDLDAAGRVDWWPEPDVTLLNVLLHVLNETNRHAGHADIMRECIDGRMGMRDKDTRSARGDATFWSERFKAIERAALASAEDP